MLVKAWVTNSTSKPFYVHSETPGSVPHPGYSVLVRPGEWVAVWIIDSI